MSDAELKEFIRSELREAIRQDREKTVNDTLKRLKIAADPDKEFISQHQASKIIGRSRLRKYITDGTIPKGSGWYSNGDGRWDRIWVNRDMVMKLRYRNRH